MVFAAGDVSNPIAPTISGATGAGATAAKVIAARLNAAK
jgi:thioredoxin reductase